MPVWGQYKPRYFEHLFKQNKLRLTWKFAHLLPCQAKWDADAIYKIRVPVYTPVWNMP